MSAEIFGKVAFLKALQREYQYRLGHLFEEEIFYRTPYFLALQLPLEDPTIKIPCRCTVCDARLLALSQELKQQKGDHQACPIQPRDLRAALNDAVGYPRYNALTFPLIWGPYTGVELMEIRANLIVQENSFREMSLPEHKTLFKAFLNSAVLCVAKPKYEARNRSRDVVGRNESFQLPIDYRMAQPFDGIDTSGSKSLEYDETQFLEDTGSGGSARRASSDPETETATNIGGNVMTFAQRKHRANFFFYQRKGKECITLMRDLTDPLGFAYNSRFVELQS
jgi:hypothetical protein